MWLHCLVRDTIPPSSPPSHESVRLPSQMDSGTSSRAGAIQAMPHLGWAEFLVSSWSPLSLSTCFHSQGLSMAICSCQAVEIMAEIKCCSLVYSSRIKSQRGSTLLFQDSLRTQQWDMAVHKTSSPGTILPPREQQAATKPQSKKRSLGSER